MYLITFYQLHMKPDPLTQVIFLGLHSYGTVEPYSFTIEHGVLNDTLYKEGVFIGMP